MYNLFENLRSAFKDGNSQRIGNSVSKLFELLLASRIMEDNTFLHPLGFIYSQLHEFENRETIRIHIWDKNRYSITPIMDIHNHYYIVNSYVYKGAVYNHLYVEDTSEIDNYAIYSGAYSLSGDRILIKTTRGMHLKIRMRELHKAGSFYRITHDQIHSGGTSDEGMTCTLVYTENPGVANPLVLGPKDAEDEFFYRQQQLENHEIASLIADLMI